MKEQRHAVCSMHAAIVTGKADSILAILLNLNPENSSVKFDDQIPG
jgi:hypothetical protein